MKNMKKSICMLLPCLILLSLLTGCGGQASSPPPASAPPAASNTPAATPSAPATPPPANAPSGPPVLIKVATNNPESDVKTQVAYRFKENLESLSNGRITVDVYPAGSLLNETTMVDGIAIGLADVAVGALGWYSGTIPEVGVIPLIGVFDSADHFFRATESSGGLNDYLSKLFEDRRDTHIYSMVYAGSSDAFATTTSAIHSLSDLKGLKVRTPNVSMSSAIEALGSAPVTIPASDTYTAFQNGVVNALWVVNSAIESRGYGEVAKYVTQVDWCYADAYAIYAADATIAGWPEDVRKMVEEATTSLYQYSKDYILEQTEEVWSNMAAKYPNIIEINELTLEESAPMKEMIAPGQLAELESICTKESYNAMMDIIKKFK